MVPPWASAYTININTQMNYWPAEATNLPELTEPLFRMVKEAAVTGAVAARRMYGYRGWVLHHNTTIWRDSFPVDGNTRAAFWNMAGRLVRQPLLGALPLLGRQDLPGQARPTPS